MDVLDFQCLGARGAIRVLGVLCHITRAHTHTHAHTFVHAIAGKRIVGLSSGRYNNLALEDTGVLHLWGLDGCGGALPPKVSGWIVRQAAGELQGQQVKAFDSGVCVCVCVSACSVA